VSELSQTAAVFGAEAFNTMKAEAGAAYDSLTEKQKSSLERATARWLELEMQDRAGQDVAAQKKFVKTTLDEFKMVGKVKVYDAFWKGVDKALVSLGNFLGAAGKSFLGGVL